MQQPDPGAFAPAADPSGSGEPDAASMPPEADALAIDEDSGAPTPSDSGVAVDGAKASPDTMSADTKVADTKVADTFVADTFVADTFVADTFVADTFVADTFVADTNVADTFVADTFTPDTNTSTLTWRKADLTYYTSYPDPGSEECVAYNGCTWSGQFAALSSKMPESWVKANNIAAVHGKDFETYKLKTLRLRQGTKQIDVKVYDMCADSDCSGCCTANSKSTGFLIDIESHTAERFGTHDGIVEWTCLDC